MVIVTQCVCGCGGTTKGGSFLPGHDARHKSNLFKEARAGNTEALAEIDQRNWMHLYDKTVAKRDEPNKPARASRSRESQGIPNDGIPLKATRLDWKDRQLEDITDEEIVDALTKKTLRVSRQIKDYGVFDEDIEVEHVTRIDEDGTIRLYQPNLSGRAVRVNQCVAVW